MTAVPAPNIPVDTKARLLGEKVLYAMVSLFFNFLKVTAFSGHISSQVLQTMHSEKKAFSGISLSIADMGHFLAHFPHWLQRSDTCLRIKGDFEKKVSNAPEGHRYLHQNLLEK